MKHILILFVTMLMFACADSNKNDMDSIRNMAKEDIIEKLNLPEGTKFDESSMEVTERESTVEGASTTYVVNVSVKSQNAAGTEQVDTHTLTYKKPEGSSNYELVTFE